MTYQSKYRVGWERWLDPYGTNAEAFTWPSEQNEDDDIKQLMNADDDLENYEKELLQAENMPVQNVPMRILKTPMGVIPMYEHSIPSRVFKLFTAHTNFRITQHIQQIVSNVPGVESLDIWSPYRMRVGIGKMFNSKTVRQEITQSCIAYLEAITQGHNCYGNTATTHHLTN